MINWERLGWGALIAFFAIMGIYLVFMVVIVMSHFISGWPQS